MRFLIFSLLIFFYLVSISTASNYMVDRHIFTPEPEIEETDTKDGDIKPQEIKKIKNQIMFTGVIILPDVKKVLLREKGKNRVQDGVSVMKEGDTINDMTINKISSNYIVLTNEKGDDIRFNLYNDSKVRPDAPPEPKNDSHGAKQTKTASTQSSTNSNNSANKKNDAAKSAISKSPGSPKTLKRYTGNSNNSNQQSARPAKSFSQAINNALEKRRSAGNTSSTSSTSNPFIEAIKRAQQRASSK